MRLMPSMGGFFGLALSFLSYGHRHASWCVFWMSQEGVFVSCSQSKRRRETAWGFSGEQLRVNMYKEDVWGWTRIQILALMTLRDVSTHIWSMHYTINLQSRSCSHNEYLLIPDDDKTWYDISFPRPSKCSPAPINITERQLGRPPQPDVCACCEHRPNEECTAATWLAYSVAISLILLASSLRYAELKAEDVWLELIQDPNWSSSSRNYWLLSYLSHWNLQSYVKWQNRIYLCGIDGCSRLVKAGK